jgi:hypothetical protein
MSRSTHVQIDDVIGVLLFMEVENVNGHESTAGVETHVDMAAKE